MTSFRVASLWRAGVLSRWISGRAAWLAVAGLASVAQPAQAQSDSAAARALFAEGRNLMADERYAEACPKFEESLRLDHGMGTQFNLAHCWEKLGRTASAWSMARRNASL